MKLSDYKLVRYSNGLQVVRVDGKPLPPSLQRMIKNAQDRQLRRAMTKSLHQETRK